MTDREWRERRAWRGSIVAVLLNLVGMPIDMLIARSIARAPLWPNVMSILVAAVLLAILVARRHERRVWVANLVFLVSAFTIVTALWFSNRFYAESGRAWVPFQANKLGMLTVALLAPQLWVGLLSIGGYAGAAVAQLATFSAATQARIALGEPWATIAIGAFAAVLFAYRLKRIAVEREVVRAQTEKAAMADFARRLLAIRDLANTPLQTIAFASASARIEHPEIATTLDRIDRAIADIKALDERLRAYERELTWMPGEESFDANDMLSPPERRDA
jgi:hypothetical protein